MLWGHGSVDAKGFGLPFKDPARPASHPLVGHMRQALWEDVVEMLARRPPTQEEADAIAADELTWMDRQKVYDLLNAYIDPRPTTEWTE